MDSGNSGLQKSFGEWLVVGAKMDAEVIRDDWSDPVNGKG